MNIEGGNIERILFYVPLARGAALVHAALLKSGVKTFVKNAVFDRRVEDYLAQLRDNTLWS